MLVVNFFKNITNQQRVSDSGSSSSLSSSSPSWKNSIVGLTIAQERIWISSALSESSHVEQRMSREFQKPSSCAVTPYAATSQSLPVPPNLCSAAPDVAATSHNVAVNISGEITDDKNLEMMEIQKITR